MPSVSYKRSVVKEPTKVIIKGAKMSMKDAKPKISPTLKLKKTEREPIALALASESDKRVTRNTSTKTASILNAQNLMISKSLSNATVVRIIKYDQIESITDKQTPLG